MKYIFALLIIQLSICSLVNGQGNTKYLNDSTVIFSKLNKSDEKDIDFGNKINGLQRHYRKIGGKWMLSWICLWENSKFIWCCKVGQYNDFSFSLDLVNLNNDIIKDSVDIIIPYENGKKWMIINIHEKNIIFMTTYFPSGEIMEEYSVIKRIGFYKKYYINGKLELYKYGKFMDNNQLLKGNEILYTIKGEMIEQNAIDLRKKN